MINTLYNKEKKITINLKLLFFLTKKMYNNINDLGGFMKPNFINFNNPETITIPIINPNDYTIIPKIGDYVYKGNTIAYNKGDIKHYIYSPISGKIIDIVNKNCFFNGISNTKCIVIENDFKEMVEELKGIDKNFNTLTKEEWLEKLSYAGIQDIDSKLPIFIKYSKNIKKMIINTCDINSNDILNNYIVKNYLTELLETIDAIIEINKISECIIVINKYNKEIIKLFEQKIGTYLKIKLMFVSDYYLPKVDEETILENLETLYYLNDNLKYDTPFIEKFITFSNKENFVLKVKLGTSINDIFKNLKLEYTDYIIGNKISGVKVNDLDLMITQNITALNAYNDSQNEIFKCIKCGKCALKCPMNLLPKEIIRFKNNKEKLTKLNIKNCLECGLCSYNCPCNINLFKEIKIIKDGMNE